MEIHQQLLTAYNQRDDVAFDDALQSLLNDGAIVPLWLEKHIVEWLKGNRIQHPEAIRWGRFPLGMVQRWIERATKAEQELQEIRQGADNA